MADCPSSADNVAGNALCRSAAGRSLRDAQPWFSARRAWFLSPRLLPCERSHNHSSPGGHFSLLTASRAMHHILENIVFATKGRRRSLREPIRAIVHESIKRTCRDYNVTIIEIGGTDDHVHLLLILPPKHAVANIVRAIKGIRRYL